MALSDDELRELGTVEGERIAGWVLNEMRAFILIQKFHEGAIDSAWDFFVLVSATRDALLDGLNAHGDGTTHGD